MEALRRDGTLTISFVSLKINSNKPVRSTFQSEHRDDGEPHRNFGLPYLSSYVRTYVSLAGGAR